MVIVLLALAVVGVTAVATRACTWCRSWTGKSTRNMLVQTELTHTGLRGTATPRFGVSTMQLEKSRLVELLDVLEVIYSEFE